MSIEVWIIKLIHGRLIFPNSEAIHFYECNFTFHDWDEECRSLSSDWQTSWHGALSPYILNIVARNGFYPTQIIGAGGTRGLYHSNNHGLHYPFKYAYPSPLLVSSYAGCESEQNLDAINADVPLYHSLVQLKVNPMIWAKT